MPNGFRLCFYCTCAYSETFWESLTLGKINDFCQYGYLKAGNWPISRFFCVEFKKTFNSNMVSIHETQYFGIYLDLKWFSSLSLKFLQDFFRWIVLQNSRSKSRFKSRWTFVIHPLLCGAYPFSCGIHLDPVR